MMRKVVLLGCAIGIAVFTVLLLRILPYQEQVTVREATPLEKRVAVLEETKADMAKVLAGCTCQQINLGGTK